jgi:putative transposase
MIEELDMDKDHVHRLVSFPPKYSIGQVVGVFKVMSVKEIRAECPAVRGYFVRTVGDKVTADVIKKYIRFQEARKTEANQLNLF